MPLPSGRERERESERVGKGNGNDGSGGCEGRMPVLRSTGKPRKRVSVLMKAGAARAGVDLLSYAGAKKSERLGMQTPRPDVCAAPLEERKSWIVRQL